MTRKKNAVGPEAIQFNMAPLPSPLEPVQHRNPVIGFWLRYATSFSNTPSHWDDFADKLRTCNQLHWLCEPKLGDIRTQHGLVFTVLELWEDAHRDEAEAQWPERLRLSMSGRKRRGRTVEFPHPRVLQAFLLMAKQAFTRKGPPPAKYRVFATKIQAHFFPEHFPLPSNPQEAEQERESLKERQRGRTLLYQRKNPEEFPALVRHIIGDAMTIVEAYPELR